MPAGSSKDFQFVTLDDFSPGIYDDYYASSGPQAAPPGAAQLSGTYGCVASAGGGLIPAPRRVNRILEAPFASPIPADPYTHITAFRVLSPVYDRTSVSGTSAAIRRSYPDQMFVALEGYTSTGVHKCVLRTYKNFMSTVTNPASGGITTYDIQTSTTAAARPTPYTYGYSSFDITRSNPADPTSPGRPTVACSFASNRDLTVTGQVAYPSNASLGTDSSQAMAGLVVSGGSACYAVMAHQDRIMCFQLSVNYGFALSGEVPFDGLIGTSPNDYSTNGFSVSTFVNENPGLFGSWSSMNASEAFFVKQQRGGYSLRGDVANPTIVRLPGVEPTGDAVNIGVIDGNGLYVYGTRNGVYAWSGGDTSPYLSPQIDGWFWKPGSGLTGVDNYLFTKGQFGRQGKYVFAPNNFLFDSTKGGWWKLTNPNDTTSPTYGFWDNSAGGYMIGAPVYLGPSQPVLADYYDIQQGQSSFQWTSQPLKVTQGRETHFREIDLIAQGTGTVTVTLTGINGETDTSTFAVASSSRPITVNQMGSCNAHDVVVTIASTATDSSQPAPRIYRLALGYEQQETAR